MTRRSALRATLCMSGLALVAGLIAYASGFAGGHSSASASTVGNVSPSFEYVTVYGEDSLDAETLATWQQLADTLALVTGVPNDRPNYYAMYNDGVNWVIGGWAASVSDAQATPDGGYDVTLLVGPLYNASPYGTTAGVVGDYTEVYHVDPAGNVQYLGAQDPEGSGGGPLNIDVS